MQMRIFKDVLYCDKKSHNSRQEGLFPAGISASLPLANSERLRCTKKLFLSVAFRCIPAASGMTDMQ